LLSLFFFPAVLSLLPAPEAAERDRVLRGMIARFMERLSRWVIRNRLYILATVVLIAAGFALSIRNVTYHLIIRDRRQMRIYDGKVDKSVVLAHTLKTAGRPILLTSLSLVAGLLVLCFSQFLPILYFGILVSLALATTTVGALVILPALLSFGN
jgi:multidrug efflux pump subunit AcrB